MAYLHALMLPAVQGLATDLAAKESLASTFGVLLLLPAITLLLHSQLAVGT